MNENRLAEQVKYNPKVHDKHKKSYTTAECKLILSDLSLADLAVQLGRTAKAIAQKRANLKKCGEYFCMK